MCYPTGDSSAICQPGGVPHYTVDATGLAWVTEPDATNRIPYSTAIDCTNWTCTGTADASTTVVAPDGSYTATELTLGDWGVNDITQAASGYSNSTTVYPRVWLKCSAGTIRYSTPGGTGRWTIDCSCIRGAWDLIASASHSCVTEVAAWQTSAGGASGLQMAANTGSVTASIWAPTLTEEAGSGLAVIPTGASAVSTGDPVWLIDNDPDVYWRSGDTIVSSITEISGTCLTTSATQIYMSGAVGSECSGLWRSLEIRR